MANALTKQGRMAMFFGLEGGTPANFTGDIPTTGDVDTQGGLAYVATQAKLFSASGSSPSSGSFEELHTGGNSSGGYTNAKSLSVGSGGDFSIVDQSGTATLVIDNQTWTATGGPMNDIGGMYITDASDVPLAYWERDAGAVSLSDGETFTASSIELKFV